MDLAIALDILHCLPRELVLASGNTLFVTASPSGSCPGSTGESARMFASSMGSKSFTNSKGSLGAVIARSLCGIGASWTLLDHSGAVGVPSGLFNPACCFHVVDVTISGLLWRVVSKKSLKRQWYCGDTKPVMRFSSRYTFRA